MTARRLQPRLFLLAVMFGLWLMLPPQTIILQTDCQPPAFPTSPKRFAWPKDAQVRVYIDQSFSPQQKQGIETAISNWNSANRPNGNNSGVTFILPPSTTPISGVNTIWVINQPPPTCASCPGEADGTYGATSRESAVVSLNGNHGNTLMSWQAANVMAHEIGHTFGLANCTTCTCGNPQGTTKDASVMSTNCGQGQNNSPQGPTPCDNSKVNEVGQYGSGTVGCGVGSPCYDMVGCLGCDANCQCTEFNPYSPILIDVNGDGFILTNLSDGVWFDLDVRGRRGHTAWIAPNSDDAFLVLDRNSNGTIDDGTELFGNMTPQPQSPEPNGFIALAEYDNPINGGNGDGRISSVDAIYIPPVVARRKPQRNIRGERALFAAIA